MDLYLGSPNGPIPRISMYSCCRKFGNFLVSDISWSVHRNLPTKPSKFGMACTPSRIHDKMIDASGYLRGERVMGCFPFLCLDALDVPTFGSLPSQLDFGFPMISSSCTSSCYANPTIGCGLGSPDSIISLSPSFVMWNALALEGYGGFPMVKGSWPYTLSCELISIPTIIGAWSSSSTNVVLIGSTCSEGIALTSTIPSLCVNSCSTFVVSCGDLWVLHVFRAIWLGRSTFEGAILGSSSFHD